MFSWLYVLGAPLGSATGYETNARSVSFRVLPEGCLLFLLVWAYWKQGMCGMDVVMVLLRVHVVGSN